MQDWGRRPDKRDITSDKRVAAETGGKGTIKIPQEQGIGIVISYTSGWQNGAPKMSMPQFLNPVNKLYILNVKMDFAGYKL